MYIIYKSFVVSRISSMSLYPLSGYAGDNLVPFVVLSRIGFPSRFNQRCAEMSLKDGHLQEVENQDLSFQECFVIIAEKKLTELKSRQKCRIGYEFELNNTPKGGRYGYFPGYVTRTALAVN